MGGNVRIGNAAASRIDLQTIDRQKVVASISRGLEAVNSDFQKQHGSQLWGTNLFRCADFLSGSSLHLFNLRGITDENFKKYKPEVGDIDTQVDSTMKSQIEDFLKTTSKGETFSPLRYIGYKSGSDQFISLWEIPELEINVQIDFELVEFEDGKPTTWSSFSHSSAWIDIKYGVKGVFQKYLMRSIPARNAHDLIIAPKTSRGKEKHISTSVEAFSLKGLRTKLVPVLDDKSKQVFKDGLPVYSEIPTKSSTFITDLETIFTMFFGKRGSKRQIQDMASYVGLLDLIFRNMKRDDQKIIADRFVEILWGKGAQRLVRGDPNSDFEAKNSAFDMMFNVLGLDDMKKYQDTIDHYYKVYK